MKKALPFILLLFISCSPRDKNDDSTLKNTNSPNSLSQEEDNDNSDCAFKNGTYPAKVNYDNPKTGHSATYSLDVEVEDCKVIQINFPNGGHLDESHISPSHLDLEGVASIKGEKGKTYKVTINH